jgi:Flp pilus assembly protein TadD
VSIAGRDSRGRSAKALSGRFTLKLTPPRGRLDGYTVPNLPAIARQMKVAPGGQLVTALGAKGALVNAGLRRGDVITKINNADVTTPGQWTAAVKGIPADQPVPVEYRRGAEVRTATIQVPPDWNPTPDYAKTFTVLVKRNPKTLGYLLASARNRIDVGKPDEAQTQLATWSPALQKTAIGQMVRGEILLAKNDLKGSLAAYTRATTADPNLAPALLGKGLVLSRLDRTEEAVPVFQSAVTSDPGSAIAQAFLAYALITTDQFDGAIAAATEATRLDPVYEDGPVAHGLALIASGQKSQGVARLRKGLTLMADQKRAEKLIAENLEPNS